jgi:hypothetical protein
LYKSFINYSPNRGLWPVCGRYPEQRVGFKQGAAGIKISVAAFGEAGHAIKISQFIPVKEVKLLAAVRERIKEQVILTRFGHETLPGEKIKYGLLSGCHEPSFWGWKF